LPVGRSGVPPGPSLRWAKRRARRPVAHRQDACATGPAESFLLLIFAPFGLVPSYRQQSAVSGWGRADGPHFPPQISARRPLAARLWPLMRRRGITRRCCRAVRTAPKIIREFSSFIIFRSSPSGRVPRNDPHVVVITTNQNQTENTYMKSMNLLSILALFGTTSLATASAKDLPLSECPAPVQEVIRSQAGAGKSDGDRSCHH